LAIFKELTVALSHNPSWRPSWRPLRQLPKISSVDGHHDGPSCWVVCRGLTSSLPSRIIQTITHTQFCLTGFFSGLQLLLVGPSFTIYTVSGRKVPRYFAP